MNCRDELQRLWSLYQENDKNMIIQRMADEYDSKLIISYLSYVFYFPGVRYVWRPYVRDVLVYVVRVHH